MSTSTFKPIPTFYHGTSFRSRLEARWAVCFDTLHIPWWYELEGFEGNGYRYLPDFFLPSFYDNGSNLWVEIKGIQPVESEFIKATLLAQAHPADSVLLTWQNFYDECWRDCILFSHDCDGVLWSEQGVPWLRNPWYGWEAARRARFDWGRADWERAKYGELPY